MISTMLPYLNGLSLEDIEYFEKRERNRIKYIASKKQSPEHKQMMLAKAQAKRDRKLARNRALAA